MLAVIRGALSVTCAYAIYQQAGDLPGISDHQCGMCQFFIEQLKVIIKDAGGPLLQMPGVYNSGLNGPGSFFSSSPFMLEEHAHLNHHASPNGEWGQLTREQRVQRIFSVDRRFTPPLFQSASANNNWERLSSGVYPQMQWLCSQMPGIESRYPYGDWCLEVLRAYRQDANLLRYGDRPDSICYRIKQCTKDAYLYRQDV